MFHVSIVTSVAAKMTGTVCVCVLSWFSDGEVQVQVLRLSRQQRQLLALEVRRFLVTTKTQT